MISRERVCKLLDYDPATGVFKWGSSRSCLKGGSVAGTFDVFGYRLIQVDRKIYRAHRLAWLMLYGEFPAEEIDHINGDRDDNRSSNLRSATRGQNTKNRRLDRDSKSGFKGVRKHANKWQARITADKKVHYLGLFASPQLAHAAYFDAAKRLHGEFASSGRQQ